MSDAERLIATAKKEIGYLEKKTNSQLDDKTANAGMNNFTKYARDLDALKLYNGAKNGYAWCDMFVDWCFVKTFGFEEGMKITFQPTHNSYGASCAQSANYYKKAGHFYTNNPKIGDQIFFINKEGRVCHTGVVSNVDKNKVYTIEGNTSSDAGVVANGGSVNDKSYPINYSRIYGYGRPNYKNEEDEDMTLDAFKKLYAEMRKEWQDNDQHSYSVEALDWAVKNGIIQGNGTIDGKPNYMLADQMSREQMITILYRFAKLIGKA